MNPCELRDPQATRRAFFRRTESRRERMRGLIELFQAKELDTRRFKHLVRLLKSEHKSDCLESNMPVVSDFR